MWGHIHVLSGELYFRDNRYQVTRGDLLELCEPLPPNPTINVEATTNIQQYEITLNYGTIQQVESIVSIGPATPCE